MSPKVGMEKMIRGELTEQNDSYDNGVVESDRMANHANVGGHTNVFSSVFSRQIQILFCN